MKLIAFTKWLWDRPVEEVAKIVAKAGFDGVDFPVREKMGMPAEVAKKMLPRAKEVFAAHGLTMEQLVTDITGPREDLDELLGLFSSVGVKKIRLGGVSLRPDSTARKAFDEHRRSLAALEPYLKKHGIKAGVQVHSGNTAHATLGLCLLCVQDRDPEWLGVQVDTGHLGYSGEPPELALALVGPYLHSVNLKAIRRDVAVDKKTGKLTWPMVIVPLRDGMVDCASFLRTLKKMGYDEALSIHPEYRSPYFNYEKYTELTTQLITEDREYVAGILKELSDD
ncbi:MAG TPA: sugar phosphate isomerase/epimerase [Firmicutes bacterium]|nr:sugar phosphate isomerase/epimerase [Bacillota bacterium]